MSTNKKYTRVEASKTMGQVMAVLAEAGALDPGFVTDLDTREHIGVRFRLDYDGQLGEFEITPDVTHIFDELQAERSDAYREKTEETDQRKARDIVWRNILDLVKVMTTIGELGGVEPMQAFLGFLVVDRKQGRTITAFERISEQFKQLPEGRGK